MSTNLDRVATFTRELAETSARVLVDVLKVPDDQAAEIGLKIASQVCDDYRGQLIYIPSGFAVRINERDQAMHAAYVASGRDIVATARQFDVTVKTAYQRIRMVEASDYAQRQGALFDSKEPPSPPSG
ncbi:MAG: Mor transcription activator family protein [Rhodanobacter sp.]